MAKDTLVLPLINSPEIITFFEKQGENRPNELISADLTLEVITDVVAFAALESEWNQLYTCSESELPFQTFAWNFSWWQIFARKGWKIQDTLLLLVLRHQGTCVGIAPFLASSPKLLLPLGFHYVQMLGADPNLTEVRTLIALPQYRQAVWERVQNFFAHEYWQWSLLRWSGVETAASMAATLSSKPSVQYERLLPNYILPLDKSWDDFRAKLKRNIRESIRHCYNSLKREGLKFEFFVGTTQADFDQLLPVFFELHTLRASRQDTVNHPNYFENPKHREFLTGL